MGPAGVVKLVEAAITIDRVKGNGEKWEPRAEPTAESPLTTWIPSEGPYDFDQLFWTSLNTQPG